MPDGGKSTVGVVRDTRLVLPCGSQMDEAVDKEAHYQRGSRLGRSQKKEAQVERNRGGAGCGCGIGTSTTQTLCFEDSRAVGESQVGIAGLSCSAARRRHGHGRPWPTAEDYPIQVGPSLPALWVME